MLKQSAVLKKKRNIAKIDQSGFDSFVKKANEKTEDSSMRVDRQHNITSNEEQMSEEDKYNE